MEYVFMESMIRVGSVPPRMIGNLVVSVDTWQCIVTDFTAVPDKAVVENPELELTCEPLDEEGGK